MTEGMSPADLAAVTGCNNEFGGNNGWWIILLLLFANGGWGNGYGNGNGFMPYYFNNTDNAVQRGFDTAQLTSQLTGINNSINTGFSAAEVANCGRAADAMQTAYTNQIATMNQNFAQAQNLDNQLNGIGMSLQNCCCENRAGIADLKYTVATEACADRASVSNALRDVIDANNASTQRILDQMCQDKIDAKNEQIANLRSELLYARGQASQDVQTAAIQAGQRALANEVEQYILPTPKPSYIVQNPNCCQNVGCGCGTF